MERICNLKVNVFQNTEEFINATYVLECFGFSVNFTPSILS